jgi:hypothetical protein
VIRQSVPTSKALRFLFRASLATPTTLAIKQPVQIEIRITCRIGFMSGLIAEQLIIRDGVLRNGE